MPCFVENLDVTVPAPDGITIYITGHQDLHYGIIKLNLLTTKV